MISTIFGSRNSLIFAHLPNDTCRFVICLRDVFYYRLLLTPAGYTYSIAMAIFCQFAVIFYSDSEATKSIIFSIFVFQMGYAAGYGLAAMLWVQLFYYGCSCSTLDLAHSLSSIGGFSKRYLVLLVLDVFNLYIS